MKIFIAPREIFSVSLRLQWKPAAGDDEERAYVIASLADVAWTQTSGNVLVETTAFNVSNQSTVFPSDQNATRTLFIHAMTRFYHENVPWNPSCLHTHLHTCAWSSIPVVRVVVPFSI